MKTRLNEDGETMGVVQMGAAKKGPRKGPLVPGKTRKTPQTPKAPLAPKTPKTPRQRKGLSMKVNTQTGTVHVRHLSEVPVGGKLVRLGATGEISPQQGHTVKRAWNQIAKAGAFAGHSAGPFELNGQVFSEIVRNFKATANKRIPVDFEHASESDPTSGTIPYTGAPAQGWVVDMKASETDLLGLFEWLEPARTYVSEGKYKFLSPAVRFGARDRVTGKPIGARLTSVALTNNPFLDGMQPVVCRDFDHADKGAEVAVELTGDPDANPALLAEAIESRIVSLSERLSLLRGEDPEGPGDDEAPHYDEPDDDDEEGALYDDDENDSPTDLTDGAVLSDSAGNGRHQPGDTIMENEKNAAAVALTDAHAKTIELSTKLSDAQIKMSALEGEIIALRAREKDRDEREIAARVTEAFETYKDDRKLSDIDREVMTATCRQMRDTFEKQYPHIPAGERHLMRDIAGQKRDPSAATPLSNTADVVQLSERNLAKQIAAQKNIPLEQAQQMVSRLSAKR